MDLELRGKRAVVTGASRGIGRACATVLAREGAEVVLASRSAADLDSVATSLRSDLGAGVTTCPVDLRDPEARARLVEEAGDVDIWVNNAGDVGAGSIADFDAASLFATWELKLFGYMALCGLVLPRFEAKGSGVIVNVIGTASIRPHPDYIAGATANRALLAMTEAVGSRSLKRGVRVVGVNPGLIMTERMIGAYESMALARFGDADRWRELVPSRPPPGRPEQVADVVAFLASARASHVCGHVVSVDGGAPGG